MNRQTTIVAIVCLVAGIAIGGCRAAPMSLAGMVAGDVVSDVEVKNRQATLLNQPETAADDMFGSRLETCDDVDHKGVTMIAYPVKLDVLGTSHYIVEVRDGRIITLSKTKQNIDGAENVIKAVDLKENVIGKTQNQAQADGELGWPVRTLRSREKGQVLRIYNVKNWTNLRGARYCVLRFGASDRCQDVKLVGVSASTKKDPAKR
jgi:hypothetical protein